MRLVREKCTMSDQFNIDQFAATINSRLGAEARIASAVAFGWQCGGYAVALALTSMGIMFAFYGYSFMISSKPSADYAAKAIAEALQRAELHTSVKGIMELKPDSEVSLAPGQSVQLSSEPLKLDPASTVRVVGDLKVDIPQPSKQQLQLDATSAANDVSFTRYTIFRPNSRYPTLLRNAVGKVPPKVSRKSWANSKAPLSFYRLPVRPNYSVLGRCSPQFRLTKLPADATFNRSNLNCRFGIRCNISRMKTGFKASVDHLHCPTDRLFLRC
jgi:hypothetical protein